MKKFDNFCSALDNKKQWALNQNMIQCPLSAICNNVSYTIFPVHRSKRIVP